MRLAFHWLSAELVEPAHLPPCAAEWALECLKVLLETNMQQNLQIVVNVAKEYTEQVRVGLACQRGCASLKVSQVLHSSASGVLHAHP